MVFNDSYNTIQAPATGVYKEKGSRFLGFAYPIRVEADVKPLLVQLNKEHPQANHHCYAFRLGPDRSNFRFSDDREPSGSAGKPILNQLLSTDVSDILLIVVRYFGGSLLGVPGLIHAYKEASHDTLKNAQIIQTYLMERYLIHFGYDAMNEVMGLLKLYHTYIIKKNASLECSVEIRVRKSIAEELCNKIKKIYKAGKPVEIEFLGSG